MLPEVKPIPVATRPTDEVLAAAARMGERVRERIQSEVPDVQVLGFTSGWDVHLGVLISDTFRFSLWGSVCTGGSRSFTDFNMCVAVLRARFENDDGTLEDELSSDFINGVSTFVTSIGAK